MNKLQELINKGIEGAEYPAQPKELYEPIGYLMALGGKRMRPLLVLMGYQLFKEDVKKALPAALAVETFHNFTLMHDDIMDNAPLRRGKATVHEKWNRNIAILSGDVMLVEAYKLLCTLDKEVLPEVLQLFNKTAVEVCEGQQFDMNFESQTSVTVEAYIEMIGLKTAVLLAASLQMGAMIANAPAADAQHLYDFGKYMGIAFQLQDDLLDVYGDPEKFGKQVGGDIISNKKTYLLIKALELANGADAEVLHQWIAAADFDAAVKVKAVTTLYTQLGVDVLVKAEMENYCKLALEALEAVNATSKEGKIALKQLTDELMERQF